MKPTRGRAYRLAGVSGANGYNSWRCHGRDGRCWRFEHTQVSEVHLVPVSDDSAVLEELEPSWYLFDGVDLTALSAADLKVRRSMTASWVELAAIDWLLEHGTNEH